MAENKPPIDIDPNRKSKSVTFRVIAVPSIQKYTEENPGAKVVNMHPDTTGNNTATAIEKPE